MSAELDIVISARNAANAALNSVKQNIGGIEKAASSASKTLKNLGGTLSGAGTKLSLGVTAPILGFAGAAIKAAADSEQLEIAFTTMLGSAEKAKDLMKDISDFSAATPFQFDEVVNAGRSLLAFGVDAGDVTDTLRRLGDVSAGIGAPLGDIAEIYGKAKVSGRLFAEDINQLTGRGIPIITELAKVLGVTEGQVKELVEKGKVGFPELQKAFENMTNEGGKFAGLMEAQSQSLGGLFSTLKDNVALALTAIGKQLIEAFDLKSVLGSALEYTGKIKDAIISFAQTNPAMFKLAAGIALAAAALGPLLIGIGTFATALGVAWPYLALIGSYLGGAFAAAIGVVLSPLALLAAALAAAFYFDVGGIKTSAIQAVTSFVSVFDTLRNYFGLVVSDGDELNDFLVDLPSWMQPAVQALGKFTASVIETAGNLGNYFRLIVEDGDYLNDFLADLPVGMQPAVESIGKFTAAVFDTASKLGSYFRLIAEDGDYLNDFLVDLPTWMQPAVEAIGRFYANLDVIPGIANDVYDAVSWIFQGRAANIDWWGDITNALVQMGIIGQETGDQLAEMLFNAGVAAGNVIQYFKDWANYIYALIPPWAVVQAQLQLVYNWLATNIPSALASLSGLWGQGVAAATEIYGQLVGYLAGVWAWVGAALPSALSALSGLWSQGIDIAVGLYATLTETLTTVWAWVSAALPGALSALSGLWEASVSGAAAAYDTVVASLTALYNYLVESIPGGLETVKNAFTSVGELFTGFQSQLTGLQEAIQPTIDTLTSIFGPALERLGEAFTSMIGNFQELSPHFTRLGEAVAGLQGPLMLLAGIIGGVLVVAADFLLNTLSALFGELPNIVGTVVDQISLTIETFSTIITELGTLVTAVINGDWTTAWTSAQTIVGSFWTYLTGFFTSAWAILTSLSSIIKSALVDSLADLGFTGASEQVDAFLEKIGELVTSLGETLTSALNTFVTLGQTNWPLIKSAATAATGVINDALKKMAEFVTTTIPNGLTSFKTFLAGLGLPNPFTVLTNGLNSIKSLIETVTSKLTAFKNFLSNLSLPSINLPSIPGLSGSQATGGPIRTSGFYRVGEGGRPETVFLPRGAYVANPFQLSTAGAGAGGGEEVHLHIDAVVRNELDIHQLAYQVVNLIRSKGK